LRHVELDPAGALDPRTADLGAVVLEPFRHHDLDTMRRAGYRIADRLVFGLEYSRDRYLGAAARQIEIELDRRKTGSSIFVTIRLKMWNIVPSAEFCPDSMPNNASRCAGVARSSMIA
jgi:hypothetical protein